MRIVPETEEHRRHLSGRLASAGTGGNLTTDAHVAAVTISLGATLVSFDHDFRRFPNLRWLNPSSTT